MDYSFHLQQGLILLEKQDATSIKKALEHIKTANEMAEDEHLGKPQIRVPQTLNFQSRLN